MLEMYTIAESERINIRWWNFTSPVLGLYWAPQGMRPVIGLDKSLEQEPRVLRCIMAEELGHHFTTPSHCISGPCFNYRDRLTVSKCEYMALRWAACYLIPVDMLEQAIRRAIVAKWELAEHFEVTEEMVDFRLGLSRYTL